MTANSLCRVCCSENASTVAVLPFDDAAEFVTNLVLWLCSLVVIALSFVPLLF
jgi:hypothetical protein